MVRFLLYHYWLSPSFNKGYCPVEGRSIPIMSPPNASAPFKQLNRRGFLASGAVLALLPALSASTVRASVLAPAGTGSIPILSRGRLGFWAPEAPEAGMHRVVRALLSGHDAEKESSFVHRLIPAEAIPFGDARFAETDVSIAIHAFAPGLSVREPAGVYRARIGIPLDWRDASGAPLEWCAWAHECGGACVNTSASAISTLPVGRNGVFRLALTVQGDGAAPSRMEFCLSPGFNRGAPKLRRGAYVLQLPSAAGSRVPNWRRLRWRSGGGVAGLFEKRLLSGRLTSPGFNYVVISVEHGARYGAIPVVAALVQGASSGQRGG